MKPLPESIRSIKITSHLEELLVEKEKLINKIADRLEGIDYLCLTITERQIVDLLVRADILWINTSRDDITLRTVERRKDNG